MIFNFEIIFVVFLIYIFTHLKHTKNNNLTFLRIVFFVFLVIVAFRKFNIGNDTLNYLNYFKKCGDFKWMSLITNSYYEKGFTIFNILISYVIKTPRLYLIVLSFIMNYGMYMFIKKYSSNYLLSVLMYVCILFFYSSMTMVRQFIAIVVVLYSIKYAKHQKFLTFILCIILASFFHSTAIIAFLIYFAYNTKFSIKKTIFILIISIICMFYIGDIFNIISVIIGRPNYYSERVGSNSISNIIYFLIYFLMFLVSLFFFKSKTNENDKRDVHFYLFILLLSASINLIAVNMNIIARAADYFTAISIVAFPNIINIYMKNNKQKFILIAVYTILIIAYSTVIIFYKPEWNSAFNYKSCIFNIDEKYCK